MPNPFASPLAIIQRNFEAILPTLPAKAGAIIVEHSAEAFRNQGWTDEGLEPWTQSKAAEQAGRATLVKTGRLWRSIRVINTTNDTVSVGSDVPYAKAYNEGFDGTANVAAHSRNQLFKAKAQTIKSRRMQTITGIKSTGTVKAYTKKMRIIQRRFLGNSHQQTEKIRTMIKAEIVKTFKIR